MRLHETIDYGKNGETFFFLSSELFFFLYLVAFIFQKKFKLQVQKTCLTALVRRWESLLMLKNKRPGLPESPP